MFEQETIAAKRLALHQLQRSQSIPTLSVLVGKPITTRQLWLRWLGQTRQVTCPYRSPAGLLQNWLTVAAQDGELRSHILQTLATLVSQPASRLDTWLTHTSTYQIQQFWQRVYGLSREGEILHSLLSMLQPQAQKTELFSLGQPEQNSVLLRHFAIAVSLLPPSSVPGLLVSLCNSDDQAAALAWLTQLAEAAPALPLGLTLTTAQTQGLLSQIPESRSKAMARSGLIDVAAPDSSSLKRWLCDRGITDETQLRPMLDLVETYGATSAVLETGLTLIGSATQLQKNAPPSVFRSYPEWLLFQYLEARSATMGRFQANARLEIQFGNSPLEADFLDAAAKIVIELDGYHHFSNAENYRRDRRKDVTLQHHGFLVLRFLSEDIISHLEDILATIERSIVVRLSS